MSGGNIPPALSKAHALHLKGFRVETPDLARVRDVMTPAVFLTTEETPVTEIGRCMLRKRVHRIIVTRDGTVCGIVTAMDILRALLQSATARPAR